MDDTRTLLVDSASLYYRAYFGLPRSLRALDQTPVNAVRGLLDFLARFITEYSPTFMAACWDDAWRPAWRVALVPSYKAHRVTADGSEDAEEDLTVQVPLIRDVLDALGIAVIGHPDHEADDVIATLATRASGPVDVLTGDRDLFQLVDDARAVRVLYVGRGLSRHERVDDAWLLQRYGITGAQYADFATLRGDPSDGLPGVPGIGEKTASKLVASYGDLSGILAHTASLAPGVRTRLEAAHADLPGALAVASVVRDLPLPERDLRLPETPRDTERFAALTSTLNLGGSAERILAALQRSGRSK